MGCSSAREKIESKMLSLKLERVLIKQEKKKQIAQSPFFFLYKLIKKI